MIFPGTRAHQGRLQIEVHHVAVEAESDRPGLTRLQLSLQSEKCIFKIKIEI